MNPLMNVKFRPIDCDNAEEVAFLSRLHEEAPQNWERDYVPSAERIEKCIRKIGRAYESGRAFLLVAEADSGSIVGFHWIELGDEEGACFGSIKSLWVDEDYRGKGIATEMKLRGEEWARSEGAKFLKTTVHVKNQEMLRLNARRGFEKTFVEMTKAL